MRRTIIIPTALLLSAFLLTGCSAAADSTASDGGSYTSNESGGVPAPEIGQLADEGIKYEDSDLAAATADREVITTGYVTITVSDPMKSATEAIRITESTGGRVDGRTEYAPNDEGDKGSATLILRIPSDSLTATLDKLRELGEVEEVSLNSDDVTMETQDLDARITALRASVDRLLGLLATATDTDTLIQLETAISDRQGELESLESQRRFYSDQVQLSTVTLNLVSEYAAPVEEPDTFISGLEAGWNAFVAFFAGLLVALGVLLPWLVFAGIVTFVVIVLVRRSKKSKPVE